MKLCMGCMSNMDEKATICPHCGYSEAADEQEAYYLTPGTVVGGKYIVGKALEYSGFAVTYIGMDAGQGHKVMIKEYLPSDFTTRSAGEKEITIYSGDALEQFEEGLAAFLNEGNEIQRLGNLTGIAAVYDCVAENDTGYVITEYLEGRTLADVLGDGTTYSARETYKFACTLLNGLAKLHEVSVVHCDIAPENIMLTEDGQVKLMNFGAARYATSSNSKSLAVILKQGYAPEEQYRSRGERGPWSDVYAVAAVMYRMMTGTVPVESVERALTDKLTEPSKQGVQIPEAMEHALMNALNVFQRDRTPSAEAFLRELNSSKVKRRKVKIKSDTGKFPVWAKGIIACMFCAAVAGGIFVYKNRDTEVEVTENKDNTSMLNVMGKTLQEAEDLLQKEGLAEPSVVYNLGGGEGELVTLQSPNAGSVIPKSSAITLFVKNSVRRTLEESVKNISQKNRKKLADELRAHGVEIAEERQENSEIQRDNLISIKENGEEFPYGQYVEAGRKLTFVVSSGSKAKKNQKIPASYIKKKYEDIKNDDAYKIHYENEKDNCVPKPMACYGTDDEYGKGEIAYQSIAPGNPYRDNFTLYAIEEIVSSDGRTVADFKAYLTEKLKLEDANIQIDHADAADTDYKWAVTSSGIPGLNAQDHCFTSDAKIRIWKDVPTPAPAVNNNPAGNGGSSSSGRSGGNSGNSGNSSGGHSGSGRKPGGSGSDPGIGGNGMVPG